MKVIFIDGEVRHYKKFCLFPTTYRSWIKQGEWKNPKAYRAWVWLEYIYMEYTFSERQDKWVITSYLSKAEYLKEKEKENENERNRS